MSTRKYVSLSKLATFLDNLKELFALKNHTHTVDSALSDTSENPVQNKVINAELDAISEGMSALESAIDDKAPSDHTHVVSESDLDDDLKAKINATSGGSGGGDIDIDSLELITVADIDTICGRTIHNASEVMF